MHMLCPKIENMMLHAYNNYGEQNCKVADSSHPIYKMEQLYAQGWQVEIWLHARLHDRYLDIREHMTTLMEIYFFSPLFPAVIPGEYLIVS